MPGKFCVGANKNVQPWRNQKLLLKGSNPTQKNFVGTGRGIYARFVECVVELKMPWEDFKASNFMTLNFMHGEGLAICQVNRLCFNNV
jgi:hypothetical protein